VEAAEAAVPSALAAFTQLACDRFLRVLLPAPILGPRFCPLVWSAGFILAHHQTQSVRWVIPLIYYSLENDSFY
jgi:hypothetical protein